VKSVSCQLQMTSLHSILRKRNIKPTNKSIQCPILSTYAALHSCVLSMNSERWWLWRWIQFRSCEISQLKHHCMLFRVSTSDIVCCLHSVQLHYVCFMRNFSNIHCVYSITVVWETSCNQVRTGSTRNWMRTMNSGRSMWSSELR